MTDEERKYNLLLTHFGEVTTLIMFVPVIVALLYRRHLNVPAWTYFGYLLALIFVNLFEQLVIWAVGNYTDFWLPYLKKWSIENTNFIGIFGYLASFLILGRFYSQIIPDRTIGKWIYILSIVLSLFAVIDYIWITGHDLPGVAATSLNGVFTTVLPMIQIWHLTRQNYQFSIYRVPYFWFSIGQILAHLFSLIFFFFSDKMYATDFMLFVEFSIARNVLRIVAQLLYAYGFSKAKTLKYL